MNYVTPYDIGIGDDVVYQGKQYMVYLNYIKGETDAKGFTPLNNHTILVNNKVGRITCLDYTQLEVN